MCAAAMRAGSAGAGHRRASLAFVTGALAAAMSGVTPAPVTGAAAPAPKVVVIVGPVGALTADYAAAGRAAARAARGLGDEVTEIVSPNATWPAVKAALQGASFVIYLGHGNGFPSPYRATIAPAVEDGFGLNPVAGRDNVAHQYFGEAYLARYIRLAPGATVLLARLCYASGNSEPGRPDASVAVAEARVDNYAAGFLAAGAGAVIADAYASPAAYVRAILGKGATPLAAWQGSSTAAGHVATFAPSRTPGTAAWVDPATTSGGWYRSIVVRAVDPATVSPGSGGWMPYEFVMPADPPGAVTLPPGTALGVPDLGTVPIAGSSVTVSVPVAFPAAGTPAAPIELATSWEPVDGVFGGGSSIGSGDSTPAASNSPSTAPPTGGPASSPAPSASISPSASPPEAGDETGPAFMAPELPASVTEPVPATISGGAISALVPVPSAAGTYRVLVTIHRADGVALDLSATIPPILVRVLPSGGAAVDAPRALATLVGASFSVLVTITNAGPADWTAEQGDATAPSTASDGQSAFETVRLTGTWIPLDDTAGPLVAGSVPVVAAAGTSTTVLFSGTAPDAPGAYLLVLALAGDRGAVPVADPATIVVSVGGKTGGAPSKAPGSQRSPSPAPTAPSSAAVGPSPAATAGAPAPAPGADPGTDRR